jgi:hypothetical protein
MTNAERILHSLDTRLNAPVELTLYGRAALHMGFANPPAEYALSQDVDAVLWQSQSMELSAATNFWEAIDEVNQELAESGLYVSHLFAEDQVILRPVWRAQRVPIAGPWKKLKLSRLSDLDLLLSKLMRDDPIDLADATFIVRAGRLTRAQIEDAIRHARVPAIPEIQDNFLVAQKKLLSRL